MSLLLLLLPVAGLVLVLWLYQYGQEQRKQERGGGGDKGTLRVRQSVTSELTIPGDVVGRVIGRHGLRVRQLEEVFGRKWAWFAKFSRTRKRARPYEPPFMKS